MDRSNAPLKLLVAKVKIIVKCIILLKCFFLQQKHDLTNKKIYFLMGSTSFLGNYNYVVHDAGYIEYLPTEW